MFYLILATICFSLSFGLIKANLAVLPSDFVAFVRLFIAALFFLPFVKKNEIKTIIIAFIIGILQFGIMYLCFIKAFKYLQGNEIALLTTTTPIYVAIISSIFGEKFRLAYILSVLLSVLGAIIVVWSNIPLNMIFKGVLLMEISNFSFALGQILWKKFVNIKDETVISYAYLGASLFVLPFMLCKTNLLFLSLNIEQILSLLYLAIVPTAIGFFLWNKGSKEVNVSTLSIMNNFKIPLGVLFSIFIFAEKINLANFLIGSGLILISILIVNCKIKISA